MCVCNSTQQQTITFDCLYSFLSFRKNAFWFCCTRLNCSSKESDHICFVLDSFLTFHTEEGCNATLRCTQTGNVTWTRSSTSEVIQEGEVK